MLAETAAALHVLRDDGSLRAVVALEGANDLGARSRADAHAHAASRAAGARHARRLDDIQRRPPVIDIRPWGRSRRPTSPACGRRGRARSPGAGNLRATPLVVGGVMWPGAPNEVYALDARSGRRSGKYRRPRTPGVIGDAGAGVNRGVAHSGATACSWSPTMRGRGAASG